MKKRSIPYKMSLLKKTCVNGFKKSLKNTIVKHLEKAIHAFQMNVLEPTQLESNKSNENWFK